MSRADLSPLAPRPIDADILPGLVQLNNDHDEALSFLDTQTFQTMRDRAFRAQSIGEAAFLFAFDQDTDYTSPNFLWFGERYQRFVYIDRVVVAETARGRGYARLLYADVFEAARCAGHESIVCEVNLRPANPSSDAFHEAMGFRKVGKADIHGGIKTVRYLERRL